MVERAPKPTIFKPKDREWTTVDANKLFEDSLQRETGESDASTDPASYGKSLWNFLGGKFYPSSFLLLCSFASLSKT